MRTLAKYVKHGAENVELQTSDGEYYLIYGDDLIDVFDMGDIVGYKLAQMFITHKITQGYENANA